MQTQDCFQMLQYLLATNSIDFIAGNFNYDILKVSENKLDIFTHHVKMVNKPAHISESLIDHVYVKKTLIEEVSANLRADPEILKRGWERGGRC